MPYNFSDSQAIIHPPEPPDMAGNDDIDYLLENRQLLLVHVEPFPAMAKGWVKRSGNRSVLVTVQDAIDKERANYQAGLISDRDLLLDYMENNMARTFFIDGRAILEPELAAQRKQDEIPDKPLLCAILAVLLVLVIFTSKHALMFAEASNNQ
jgi:hypothetical protein